MAEAIGWKSHSYLGRILRGTVKEMDTDAALRIAHYFGVPVDDLFLTRVSGDNGRAVRAKRTQAA